MSTIVLTVSQTTMDNIKRHYMEYETNQLPSGSVFLTKTPTCTITGYRSGKVMFQGKGAKQEAAHWGTANENKKKTHSSHKWAPPKNIHELSIIGSDECGTGDYFGPMTVAAVFATKEQLPLLQELGVKDSKYLTDSQIQTIAKDLLHTVPYSLLILHNKKYNELQKTGINQGKMKALLHNQALLNVIKKIDGKHYDGILIDQFADPTVYFRYLNEEAEKMTAVYFATKAESIHLSVAAASIIARYSFLQEMDQLSQQVGLTLPKGAGHIIDETAVTLVKTQGKGILKQYAKLHFANTKKALNLTNKNK